MFLGVCWCYLLATLNCVDVCSVFCIITVRIRAGMYLVLHPLFAGKIAPVIRPGRDNSMTILPNVNNICQGLHQVKRMFSIISSYFLPPGRSWYWQHILYNWRCFYAYEDVIIGNFKISTPACKDPVYLSWSGVFFCKNSRSHVTVPSCYLTYKF